MSDVFYYRELQGSANSRFAKQIVDQGLARIANEGLRPEQIAALPPQRLAQAGEQFVRGRQNEFFLSLNANPVELAALIARTDADEVMVATQIYDHAARVHSFEIVSGLYNFAG